MKKIFLLVSLLSVWSSSLYAVCSASLDMGNNRIVNLGEPTLNSDGATRNYAITTLGYFKYGTITYNGRTWLDKNLGAVRSAESQTDELGYGDLYQWGRPSDGHQIRTSGTTSTQSDTPTDSLFITGSSDWRATDNTDLWNATGTGTNEVCPNGYRLPIEAEFSALVSLDTTDDFANKLRLPFSGYRHHSTGALTNVETHGHYWTSTITGNNSNYLRISSGGTDFFSTYRGTGFSVRCIKN